MRKTSFVISLIIFLIFLNIFIFFNNNSICFAEATLETVIVMGSSSIESKQVAKAKESAIINGLCNSINKMLFDIVPADQVSKNFKSLSSLVKSRDKFIKSYKVLSETWGDGIYTVLIQSNIFIDKLKEQVSKMGIEIQIADKLSQDKKQDKQKTDDSGKIDKIDKTDKLSKTDKPIKPEDEPENKAAKKDKEDKEDKSTLDKSLDKSKTDKFISSLVIIVTEDGYENKESKNFSEISLTDKLKSKGFKIIDPKEYGGFEIADKSNIDDIVALGKQVEADFVIIGETSLQKLGANKAFNAFMTIRVFQTRSGYEVFTYSKKTVSLNPIEALSSCGNLASDEFYSKFSENFSKKEKDIKKDVKKDNETDALPEKIDKIDKPDNKPEEIEKNKIKITVLGASNLGNFVIFRRALNNIPEVKKLQTQDIKDNEAIILIDTQSSSQEISNILSSKNFDYFTIKISQVLPSALIIELIAKNW